MNAGSIPSVLLSILSVILAYGMLLFTSEMALSKVRHAQRFISRVILKLINLTVKTKHPGMF